MTPDDGGIANKNQQVSGGMLPAVTRPMIKPTIEVVMEAKMTRDHAKAQIVKNSRSLLAALAKAAAENPDLAKMLPIDLMQEATGLLIAEEFATVQFHAAMTAQKEEANVRRDTDTTRIDARAA